MLCAYAQKGSDMILSKMILEGDAKKRAAAQELIKTELGITFVKDTFQRLLAQELNLMRVDQ
ncbi:MAG: hypothetical protein US69_C0008G0006 [candidate division TM6 bacterium GW2011_GWF2_38_10]|nr:MAG: hypothetical protein US69_C0008G0006 [candidate division TM6 bacterium GW2011_GWF2_38_10]